MSVDVVPLYVAVCGECGWESDEFDQKSDAESAAEDHEEECGEEVDPRSSWEIYQEKLDEIVEAIVAR